MNSEQDLTKDIFVNKGQLIGIYGPRVKLLKHIVDETDAKIVLVSSWKTAYLSYIDAYERKEPVTANSYRHAGKYLREKFRKYGLEIYDTTKMYELKGSSHRGEGIYDWVRAHPETTNWIVLDDEIFPDYAEFGILDHLVKTSYRKYGLTEDKAERAIELLNKEVKMTNLEWVKTFTPEEMVDFYFGGKADQFWCPPEEVEFYDKNNVCCKATIENDKRRPDEEDCRKCFMQWLMSEH